MDELFEKGVILGVEKFGQPNAPKKLFPYDFALVNMVRPTKDLLRTFETMIYLELYKRDYSVHYTNGIDFFIESKNEALLALPFATEEMVRGKISKLLVELRYHAVETVTIITMGLDTTIDFDTYSCQVIPFWTWAVSL
jgi:predicted AAA+ superfamily ATPase